MNKPTSLPDLYKERDRLKKLIQVHEDRYNDFIEKAGKALAKAADAAQKGAAVQQAITEEILSRQRGPGSITVLDEDLKVQR